MKLSSWLILILWLTFLAYWVISARGVKKNVQQVGPQRRYLGIIFLAMILVLGGQPYFRGNIFPHTAPVEAASVILCGAGIAFAVWARWHLGKNWSATPSIKEGHELVTSGPYRFVRHPIYTGVLLAMFGSMLVSSALWLIVFAAACTVFVWRIRVEEGFMMQLFPQQYPEYRKRTNALIPFVW